MMSLRAFCALPFYFTGPRPHIMTPARCARALHFAKLRLPANGAHPLCVVSLFHKALPAHSDAHALCAGGALCKIPPAHKRGMPSVRGPLRAPGVRRCTAGFPHKESRMPLPLARRRLWQRHAGFKRCFAGGYSRRPAHGQRPALARLLPGRCRPHAAALSESVSFARCEMRPTLPLCLPAARPPRYSCGVWGQAAKAQPAPSRAGSM